MDQDQQRDHAEETYWRGACPDCEGHHAPLAPCDGRQDPPMENSQQVADLALPLYRRDPERVVLAAASVAELVRRMNHSTFDPTSWRYPSQINSAIASLESATAMMRQLLQQIAAGLDRFTDVPGLYADSGAAGPVVAAAGSLHLDDAQAALATVNAHLRRAHRNTSQLGLNPKRSHAPAAP